MTHTAGIYVHIPFCERKCTYCNFNTTDFDSHLAIRYAEALARELSYWGKRLERENNQSLEVDTIYFGGGTPSMVEADQLASLLRACCDNFRVLPGAEITIEINPASLSERKIGSWLDAGINRASVGVQSFIDTELVRLSRTHSSSQALQTVDELYRAGFNNVSLDLIAGLPEQSLEDWNYNLKTILGIKPQHLSLYLLEIKEGTQLYGQVKRGKLPVPDDDLAAEMYRMICEMTKAAGYEHYEISNFALASNNAAGGEQSSLFRSRHNMKYWTGAPFYGFGCGAHSYDGRARRVNVLNTEAYMSMAHSQGYAIREYRRLTNRERASEALFMGLRLSAGIDLEEFRAEYGVDVASEYGAELERFIEAGLVEISSHRMRFTDYGLLLSNEVFQLFV